MSLQRLQHECPLDSRGQPSAQGVRCRKPRGMVGATLASRPHVPHYYRATRFDVTKVGIGTQRFMVSAWRDRPGPASRGRHRACVTGAAEASFARPPVATGESSTLTESALGPRFFAPASAVGARVRTVPVDVPAVQVVR